MFKSSFSGDEAWERLFWFMFYHIWGSGASWAWVGVMYFFAEEYYLAFPFINVDLY